MITCKLIGQTVAETYEIDLAELYTRRRRLAIVQSRQTAWTLATRLTQKSIPQIGMLMGGFDHTTVLHARNVVGQRMAAEPGFRDDFERLEARIKRLAGIPAGGEDSPEADARDMAARAAIANFADAAHKVEQMAVNLAPERLMAAHATDRARWATERERLTGQIQWLQAELASDRRAAARELGQQENGRQLQALQQASRQVTDAARAVKNTFYTMDEKPARRRLDAAHAALETILERTKS